MIETPALHDALAALRAELAKIDIKRGVIRRAIEAVERATGQPVDSISNRHKRRVRLGAAAKVAIIARMENCNGLSQRAVAETAALEYGCPVITIYQCWRRWRIKLDKSLSSPDGDPRS